MENQICKAPTKGGMAWVAFTRFSQIVREYGIRADDFDGPVAFSQKGETIKLFTTRREHIKQLGGDPARIDSFLTSLQDVPHERVGVKYFKNYKFKISLYVSESNDFSGFLQIFRNSYDEYKY